MPREHFLGATLTGDDLLEEVLSLQCATSAIKPLLWQAESIRNSCFPALLTGPGFLLPAVFYTTKQALIYCWN